MSTQTAAEWLTAYDALEAESTEVDAAMERAEETGNYGYADEARADLNEKYAELTHDAATALRRLADLPVLLNRAADDVLERVEAGDEGIRDVVNLLVNVIGARLVEPDKQVDDVIRANYEPTEEDGDVVAEVIGWCRA